MQQRQPRPGDVLDDYCPRERRLTNHVVVAMIGDEIKQTRCSTCDTDHEYRHAKVPRPRRKIEPVALAAAQDPTPKRVIAEPPATFMQTVDQERLEPAAATFATDAGLRTSETGVDETPPVSADELGGPQPRAIDDGPVHRQLIRAQLPRIEGQPAASRPAPDFSIRQPAGRQNRFRPRYQQGAAQTQGHGGRHHAAGGANSRGVGPRPSGGRPPMASPPPKRQGFGGKRSK